MKEYQQFLFEASVIPFKTPAIRNDIKKALAPLLKKEFLLSQIPRLLKKLEKKYLTEFTFVKSPELDSGDVSLIGYFDEEGDRLRELGDTDDYPIEIKIVFSSKDTTMAITKEGLNGLAWSMAETISHEWIHRMQAQARGHRGHGPTKKRATYRVDNIHLGSYLGHDDEIEAHAYNIAGELLSIGGNVKVARKLLQRPKKGWDMHLDQYMDTFGSNHPILKRLFKKIFFFIGERAKNVKQ